MPPLLFKWVGASVDTHCQFLNARRTHCADFAMDFSRRQRATPKMSSPKLLSHNSTLSRKASFMVHTHSRLEEMKYSISFPFPFLSAYLNRSLTKAIFGTPAIWMPVTLRDDTLWLLTMKATCVT